MLSFQLSDEQTTLYNETKKFALNKIRPISLKADQESSMPLDLFNEAYSLGLVNLFQDSQYGGTGLSVVDCCLVIEALSYGCAGITTSIVANDLALTPIKIFGSEDQKKNFITSITKQPSFASFCLSEPGAGSDAAGIKTVCKKEGKFYRLNGSKQWITNGGLAKQYTVFATIDPKLRHKGICCLVVPADSKGVIPGKHEDKLGQRASNTTPVIFEDVKVPEENLIGKEGDGFKIAMTTLDYTRPMTAMIAIGIAQAAYEASLSYAKERKQFSQPIANFQAIQFMLADIATNIEAARLLTLKSAFLLDQNKRATLYSSMAKRFSADIAMQATLDAVQIHGGYGYTKEYFVEKFMRDAKLMQIYEGTSQIQRVVIAKEILNY